jgi:hypothetical protein
MEYSQWFCSADNTAADALLRDNDRSNKELAKILCSQHCPSQLPRHFKIVPLPRKITSWLQTAVSGNKHQNDTQAWNGYLEYCDRAGLGENIFLDGRSHRIGSK